MARRVRVGRVLSAKMQKTVVVVVERVEHHPLYKKAVRKVTKLYAHDPHQECRPGDLVRVVEARPLSKTKRWLVKAVVSRPQVPEVEAAVGALDEGEVVREPSVPQVAEEGGQA